MSRRNRHKGHKEKRERGGFVALPYVCLRSPSFASLSSHAVKLLLDMLAQYRGDNNGDLSAAWTLMKERHWRSKSTLNKARCELLDKGWIETTRQGGLHQCSLYAVTFLAIDECQGKIEVRATHSPKSTWRIHEAQLKRN